MAGTWEGDHFRIHNGTKFTVIIRRIDASVVVHSDRNRLLNFVKNLPQYLLDWSTLIITIIPILYAMHLLSVSITKVVGGKNQFAQSD